MAAPTNDETTPLLATRTVFARAINAEPNPGEERSFNDQESSITHDEDANRHAGENENEDDENQDRPLPRTQIFLLCYARLVEPIAFFAIFPFINKMIWETGSLEEADVGFYSGLIVCYCPFPYCMERSHWSMKEKDLRMRLSWAN